MVNECPRCGQESSSGLCTTCRSEADVQSVRRGTGNFRLMLLVFCTILVLTWLARGAV